MEAVGYVAVRNKRDKSDGRWNVDGKRQVVYCRKELPPHERLKAAEAISNES